MAGIPPGGVPGPTRVIIDTKSDKVEDWKEEYKQFLLSVKDSHGYFRYRWGPWSEDMSKLEIIATWMPSDNLTAFGSSEQHKRAIDAIKPVLKEMPSKCPRFDFDMRTMRPPPQQILDCAVCEFITVTHCTGDPAAMAEQLKKAESHPGCMAAHSGVAATNTPNQGTIWLGFVGWTSMDASLASDKGSYIPSGVGDVESHHTNFNFPIKGFSVTNPGR